MTDLEARYRRLFAAYPPAHRAEREEEMVTTLLDVARKDPDRDTGELVERLRVVNARAIELTEALLLEVDRRRGALGEERAIGGDVERRAHHDHVA